MADPDLDRVALERMFPYWPGDPVRFNNVAHPSTGKVLRGQKRYQTGIGFTIVANQWSVSGPVYGTTMTNDTEGSIVARDHFDAPPAALVERTAPAVDAMLVELAQPTYMVNGAQVMSLVQVVQHYRSGLIQRFQAIALLRHFGAPASEASTLLGPEVKS